MLLQTADLFAIKTAAVISAAVAVFCETSVTIKFTGHELPPALALGLPDDDAVVIIAHEFLYIKERLGEGGADGLELAKVSDDGQHRLFRAFAVYIGVQAKGVNVGRLAVLEVLHVEALLAGEAVKGFLILCEIFDVGLDDGHCYFLHLKIFGML